MEHGIIRGKIIRDCFNDKGIFGVSAGPIPIGKYRYPLDKNNVGICRELYEFYIMIMNDVSGKYMDIHGVNETIRKNIRHLYGGNISDETQIFLSNTGDCIICCPQFPSVRFQMKIGYKPWARKKIKYCWKEIDKDGEETDIKLPDDLAFVNND